MAAKHALERVSEAEQLALEGKLTPAADASLKQGFSGEVASLKQHLGDLQKKGETSTATAVGTTFETALRGDYLVLASLSAGTSPELSGTLAASTSPSVAVEIGKLVNKRRVVEASQRIQKQKEDIQASN